MKQLLCALVVSQSAAWSSPILIAAMVALTLHRLVLTSLGMCRADRRIVGCHLVGRGCGMTRLCVLEANARFPTEYDSKGYGLMRLAGHTPSLLTRLCQGRVGEHEAMRNVLRLRQVGGQLSPNCMLDFTLGASALKQLSLSFFPTCQVRVVRFYHSCSPSSPSPSPPSPPPGPLLPLPCPLPPCQLFAKLFANFRTQWALLDLNCKGLSALGTAGPQPGTFRAQ